MLDVEHYNGDPLVMISIRLQTNQLPSLLCRGHSSA